MVKQNEKGFTLVEMLLVLSVVMVMTSSIILASTSKFEEMEQKRFFRQFHLDIQRLQSIAIGEEKYTYLQFSENGTNYIAKSSNIELFAFKLPSTIRLSRDSVMKEIIFHPSGSVGAFGTLLFETAKGSKRVTVYIGTGRLNYEE